MVSDTASADRVLPAMHIPFMLFSCMRPTEGLNGDGGKLWQDAQGDLLLGTELSRQLSSCGLVRLLDLRSALVSVDV
jgi:hypothetical protein